MKAAILGKKVGMTRVFGEDGSSLPVTIVQAGPCPVLQVRKQETDGYEAVQLGFESTRPGRSKKPEIGHAAAAGVAPPRFVREIRLTDAAEEKPGEVVTVGVFEEQGVQFVDVVGTTIGKGYQGVMRRHGFGGQPASHGTERKHRSPGGIGGSGDLGRGRCIKKGRRMAGQMGHVRSTSRNLRLVSVDKERNLLLVAGSVPGPRNGYLIISKAKTKS